MNSGSAMPAVILMLSALTVTGRRSALISTLLLTGVSLLDETTFQRNEFAHLAVLYRVHQSRKALLRLLNGFANHVCGHCMQIELQDLRRRYCALRFRHVIELQRTI